MTTASVASTAPPSAAREWKAHWPVVLAAMFGISFGSIPTATLGLFMVPLEQEFGWSRTQISSGMMVFAIVGLVLTPFAGALVDKFAARRLVVPGLVLSGLAFAAFGLMSGPLYQWFLIWIAYTLTSLLIRSMVWNSAISKIFTAGRGLAIACVLSGLAITQSAAPILAHLFIENFGWRGAYPGIGLGWAGLALILVLLFFHEAGPKRQPAGQAKQGAPSPTSVPGGLTLRQALRSWPVLRIAFAITVQAMIGAAVAVHLVPILTASGITRAEAAILASVLGICSVAGKLLTGWLVDRIESGFLPLIVFALPAVGYMVLLQGSSEMIVLGLGVACLGYGSGAGLQMATYLTTRYAGLRHFGKIFGLISSMMGLAAGAGPLIAGMIYDTTGAYTAFLAFAVPALLASGIAVFRLGKYPDFEPKEVRE